MRTSLNEIMLIEKYLQGNLSVVHQEEVEQKLRSDFGFYLNVSLQRSVYRLLKLFRRARIRSKIEEHHVRIFEGQGERDYQQEIERIFNP